MAAAARHLRILDFTPTLGMGGVATGMMRVLETINKDRFQIDFLLTPDDDRYYEAKALEHGSAIYRCANPSYPLHFALNFFRILSKAPRYDILHSRSYAYSGYVMLLGALAGIRIRLVHAHNDHRHLEENWPLHKKLRHRFFLFLIQRLATGGIAISPEAAAALFGKNWKEDPRWKVIPVGTDFRPFEEQVDGNALRRELAIPQTSCIIGMIGRFMPQKNHAFALDVAAALIRKNPDTHFLLIGDGPLVEEARDQARVLGIEKSCTFAGVRPDIPAFLTSLIDVVFFPSLHEGLGRVAVEGQAAGIPVIASDHIPPSADLYEGGIVRLSLEAPIEEWVKALQEALARRRKPLQECLDLARASPLSIEHHIKNLERFYEEQEGTN